MRMSSGSNQRYESVGIVSSIYLDFDASKIPDVVAERVRLFTLVTFSTAFGEYPFLGFSVISSDNDTESRPKNASLKTLFLNRETNFDTSSNDFSVESIFVKQDSILATIRCCSRSGGSGSSI